MSDKLIPEPPVGPEGVPTFTVFATGTCPYCHKAIEFLQALGNERGGFKLAVIDANQNPQVFAQVAQATRRTTVPQIFLDQNFVGGWDDLSASARNGKLDAYLSGEEVPNAMPAPKKRRWPFGKGRKAAA